MALVTRRFHITHALLAVVGVFAAMPAALAGNVTVSESLSSQPQNSAITLLNFGTAAHSGLVTSSTLTTPGGGATVVFSSGSGQATSGLYQGTTTGIAAAPYGTTAPLTQNYLAAEPNGAVTMNFATQQQYFGMDWGSVDSYNTLSFYNNGTLMETLTGSQIAANANGNQEAAGSYLVDVDFTNGASFNTVVATDTTSPAFEFDAVAYAPTAIPITPAAIAAAGNQGQDQVVTANPAPMRRLGSSPLGLAVLLGVAGLVVCRRATPRPLLA
jgi:hypothetical protein